MSNLLSNIRNIFYQYLEHVDHYFIIKESDDRINIILKETKSQLYSFIVNDNCIQLSDGYGRTVILVDRFYPSSKTCSKCGQKHDNLKLSDRIFIYPHCGFVIDRDLNTAINLKNEGYRIFIGVRSPESKREDRSDTVSGGLSTTTVTTG